jgi:hypothetical protein
MDEAYFLFETLLMLDRNRDVLKDFEITLLANPQALSQLQDGSEPIISGITTKVSEVTNVDFDISVNFSMNEASWPLHNLIKSSQKLGPHEKNKQLFVSDVWSSYLMTLKARAPFLTFHMQDIYKNILGVKKISQSKQKHKTYQHIVIGLCNTSFFSAVEQERLIDLVNSHCPHLKIRDISEIDPVSNLSQVLYVGPANFEALKICEAGATGIFLSSQFQGFNLLPHDEGHYVISSKNSHFISDKLLPFITHEIMNKEMPQNFPYAVYQIDEENLFGSFLKSHNSSDDNYPFYQAHVVLWNYLLNLFDINLEIITCQTGQIELLNTQVEVLTKLIRLYDYVMSSVDTIYQEAKSSLADNDKINAHIKNLQEMEGISDKISQSHAFLRPVLDFYRIRRGQNSGSTLLEQAQHSFLTYSEEHQALKAMLELFTVTLRKNEVSI